MQKVLCDIVRCTGAPILLRPPLFVALYFKDQVITTITSFHWGARRPHCIDTLSWFSVVFAHGDHGSRPHTATLSLFQTKRFKFFNFNPFQKFYCKTNHNANTKTKSWSIKSKFLSLLLPKPITPHMTLRLRHIWRWIRNGNRRVNLVERVISFATTVRVVRLSVWLAWGDPASWLQQMAPNVSVAGIHCWR